MQYNGRCFELFEFVLTQAVVIICMCLFTTQNLPYLDFLDMAYNSLSTFDFDHFDQVNRHDLCAFITPCTATNHPTTHHHPRNTHLRIHSSELLNLL